MAAWPTKLKPLTFLSRVALALSAVALAAAFSFYVWPTPWSYYQQLGHNLRVNRFTGDTQMLTGDGWRHYNSKDGQYY